MLFGVLSDIHSNIEAFEAVLTALAARQVEGYICCGDIVGYGPSPNEVIERLSKLPNLFAVSGNHDLAVVGKMKLEWFNDHALAAILWTQKQLAGANWKFLEALPPRIDHSTFNLVHGSPRNPPEEYVITRQVFLDNVPHIKTSPCFVGHSHITCSFGGDPKGSGGVQSRLLGEGHKLQTPAGVPWILNPGSVGQPRDRDVRASCGLFDDQSRTFEILRAAYDIPGVQLKMKAAGLPSFLAERLTFGQ